MKKARILILTLTCVFCLSIGSAKATLYTFYGEDQGGVGSATMNIVINDNKLTAELNNISPVDLIGGSTGGNSPGITGFGFNLDPYDLILLSWKLTAYTTVGDLITIGDSESNLSWQMQTFFDGVTLDYLPTTGVPPLKGALFNPDAIGDQNNTLPGGANQPSYFTTALLTMNFDEVPFLAEGEWSPFVRMYNVGIEGEGSLKLTGTPVPEPATMLLLGFGLIGLAVAGRRNLRK